MELIFGGVIVSLLVQWLKGKFGTTEYATLLISVLLSIVGALVFFGLNKVGSWQTAVQIFTIASAFYAVIVKRFITI